MQSREAESPKVPERFLQTSWSFWQKSKSSINKIFSTEKKQSRTFVENRKSECMQ